MPRDDENTPTNCLETIIKHACNENPSWLEISNLTLFLNYQMKQCRDSNFTKCPDELPGFRGFITKFLIQMSKDFATRSVKISDESQRKGFSKVEIKDRQRWESTPHPYVFFNQDGHSVSFFGFFLEREDTKTWKIVDERTKRVLHEKIINDYLYQALKHNNVVFNISLDEKSREEKIKDLCMVLGVEHAIDVDKSYELTSDNVMKMMAIWMRFKCSIPVMIMGETGCGKTRLIR